MSDLVTYKGYHGEVVYEDGRLVVSALHLNDLLITECDAASQVEAAFQEMIDDYLETCRKIGRDPERPFKGTFNVRITPDLHRKAAMAAARADRSLNSFVEGSIKKSVAEAEPRKKKALAEA